jgi:excisionase family DNA binding protein
LCEAAHFLAKNDTIALVPVERDLTTQQAADLLNVSRPYLIKLLESGALPFHKTGRTGACRWPLYWPTRDDVTKNASGRSTS